jgi:hypothetical protein
MYLLTPLWRLARLYEPALYPTMAKEGVTIRPNTINLVLTAPYLRCDGAMVLRYKD